MSSFNLTAGDDVYKYHLVQHIGSGQFGEVWLANDNSLARPFAIKFLDASQTSIDNELMEARIGNRMKHDNLVQVHIADVVQINNLDTVIIAMDYLKEGSIVEKICAGNFVPLNVAVSATIDILRGLEFLHDNGFYHNDIKPQNILIGDNQEALLTDYGISGISPNGQAIKPKLQYMPHKAPETYNNGLIDEKSDVYQAGITLFRLINGLGLITSCYNKYSEADYAELVKKGRLLEKAGWQPFVPNSLKKVVRAATNSDEAKRYASALEMRRALEKLSFPNSWVCEANGAYRCEAPKYSFDFEIVQKAHNVANFTAFRTSKKSGKRTKIGKFTLKNLNRAKLEKAQRDFMTAVVEGKV